MSQFADKVPARSSRLGSQLRLVPQDRQAGWLSLPLPKTPNKLRLVRDQLAVPVTSSEMWAALQVERNRPRALRQYDQIAMRASDLLRQVKLIAPYLEGKRVILYHLKKGGQAPERQIRYT